MTNRIASQLYLSGRQVDEHHIVEALNKLRDEGLARNRRAWWCSTRFGVLTPIQAAVLEALGARSEPPMVIDLMADVRERLPHLGPADIEFELRSLVNYDYAARTDQAPPRYAMTHRGRRYPAL